MKTQAEKLKFLRAQAKRHGLTFKAVNSYWNDVQAYALFNRVTGERVTESCDTISNWYDNEMHNCIIMDFAA
jgi:hypothetical protein